MEAPEDEGKENAPSSTQPADSGQAKVESASAVATGKPEAAAAVAPAVSAIDASRRLPGGPGVEHYVTQKELRTTQTQNLILEMVESEIELQQAENFTPPEATQNFALEAAVSAAAVGEQNFTTVLDASNSDNGLHSDWCKATTDDINSYRSCLKLALKGINIPSHTLGCQGLCSDKDHYKLIDEYYNKTVECIFVATDKYIPKIKSYTPHIVPGWVDYAKEKHDLARLHLCSGCMMGNPDVVHLMSVCTELGLLSNMH